MGSDRQEYVTAYARLLALLKGKQAYLFISALIIIVLILLIGLNRPGSNTEDANDSAADGTAAQSGETSGQTPSVAELEAQEPADITEGVWLFHRDDTAEELAYAIYSMDFAPDGTCEVPGEDIVQSGTYTVDGDSVEIELHRRSTFEGQDSYGKTVTADGEWYEWFHMTRTGNTMRGPWEGQNWEFSPDEGFKVGDNYIKFETAFAHPE